VVSPAAGSGHIHLPELFDQQCLTAPAGGGGGPAAVAEVAQCIAEALQGTATPFGSLRSLRPPRWLPGHADAAPEFDS